MAWIDGEIPSIHLKDMKMGHFTLLNRKISADIPQTELYSAAKLEILRLF